MSEQELIDAAKAPIVAYNEKDWNAVRMAVAPGFGYDEVGTQRKMDGVDAVIEGWRGWATAMPDSRATFENALVQGDSVILEVTWRGTHTGSLQSPKGEIRATGKTFEVRACQVFTIESGKAKSMRHYFDMLTLLQQLGVS